MPFAKMLRTCVLTVLMDTTSSSRMNGLLRPSSSRAATSVSHSVRPNRFCRSTASSRKIASGAAREADAAFGSSGARPRGAWLPWNTQFGLNPVAMATNTTSDMSAIDKATMPCMSSDFTANRPPRLPRKMPAPSPSA